MSKRRIDFGNFVINNSNRRENRVVVEIELKDEGKGPVLTVCGEAWNRINTDLILGGQCLDELKQYVKKNKLFNEIYRLWKLYHLNDLHAGTPTQERLLDDYFKKIGERYSYDKACDYLKGVGLYEVIMEDGSKFKYGHKWLYEPIPENDLNIINDIINGKFKAE